MYEPEYDNHTITQSLEMGSMRKPLRSESESVKKEREVRVGTTTHGTTPPTLIMFSILFISSRDRHFQWMCCFVHLNHVQVPLFTY